MQKDAVIYKQAAVEALVKAIREDPYYDSNEAINGLGICDVRVILNDLPSAQPERQKGEWILECDAEGEGDNLYRCPECGCNYSCQEYDIPNFCPNCGSYNGGENDDKG